MERLQRDDCCVLGRWLYGGGQRWTSTPGFTELVDAHRTFHAEAGKVGQAVNQGQTERAEKLLSPGAPFVEAGKQVIHALRGMQARITGGKVGASPAPRRLAAPAAAAEDNWATF